MNLKSDLTGKVFGRWTVIGPAPKPTPSGYWLCRCVCGNEKTVRRIYLTTGRSWSCPCSRRKILNRKARKPPLTHGHARVGRVTPEYMAYAGAKNRCNKPTHSAYAYYGGRGIQFRFKSFKEFLIAIGPKPSPELTLERINNDGHYEPGNVRWATRAEQNRNKRNPRSALNP